jgi:putative ABC transport system ATP-binding protein
LTAADIDTTDAEGRPRAASPVVGSDLGGVEMRDNPTAEAVVSLDGVRVVRGGRTILEVPSWSLEEGGRALLTGPSGSGKTTLLQLIAGLSRPSAGRIRVAGIELSGSTEAALDRFRATTIGFVFQTLHLVPALSVLDNLRLAAFVTGRATSDDALRARLAAIGLADRARNHPSDLSQGEAQRVAIARALVNEPRLVLADEPTSALDDRNARAMLDLLRSETQRCGAALLVATHDARLLPFFERRLELEARS